MPTRSYAGAREIASAEHSCITNMT